MAAVETPARPQATRNTSQTGTRRERFLKSLGIPSFQHPIERKEPLISSKDQVVHGGATSTEPRPTPSSSTPLDRDTAADADKPLPTSTTGERSSKLLSPSDADKRASSIRLRNYKSIGNLDVKAREDLAPDEEDFYRELMSGGMLGAKSMPLHLNQPSAHEELEALSGNLTRIQVSARSLSSLDRSVGPEKTEVTVQMRASGVEQEYTKAYQDFATLHDGMMDWRRTNGHLRDLYIPDPPSCIKPIIPQERIGSSLSQTSNGSPQSTTSRPTIASSKKRQGSFLSNLQNKVKNTIRVVSEGSRSGTTSPINQPASPPFLAVAPLSPALTPSNSLGQTSSSLGLGKFDFEDKTLSPMIEQFTTPENLAQKPPDSPVSETADQTTAMTLDSAAALVTAMTVSEGFAKIASRPSSVLVKSGGLYGKEHAGSHLLPSPLLDPVERVGADEISAASGGKESSILAKETESLNNDAKELSAYLNLLAQQLAIRSSLPWIKFFASTASPNATQAGRIAWDPNVGSKADQEREKAALTRMSSSQRKKMVRKSRSLGEGLIALFAAGQADISPSLPVGPPAEAMSNTTTQEPLQPIQTQSSVDSAVIAVEECHTKDIECNETAADTENSRDSDTIRVDVTESDKGGNSRPETLMNASNDSHITVGSEAANESSTQSDLTNENQPANTGGDDEEPAVKVEKRKRPGRKAATVDDFELIRVLGKGCAGKVVLVKYKKTGGLFAMKAIVKQHVLAHQELAHTLTEQSVLRRMSSAELSNPFIVKLWWSFHDEDNLYLVLDFLPGGDLATQLSRWERLGRDRARFYTCEIVEGVEALHAAGIIYRDLKPENILLGADGHVSLADFGLAAEFPDSKGPLAATPGWMGNATGSQPFGSADSFLAARDSASSFVGTAEYLAPEVIKGLPYSYEVDWWALGTMLYEALIGNTPFWVDNHAEMYMRVVNEELRFPEDRALDKETKSFIRGLLQKDPVFRLCEPRIRKHPYLAMVNWDHVQHKRYIPPYIPPTDKNLEYDVQNFDDSFLAMDLALKAEVASTSADSETEESDKEVVVPAEDAFDGYQYRHQDIVSVFEPEISVIDERTVEDDLQPDIAETSSSSSPAQSNISVEDPVPDTTVTSTPTVEAATAMLQRIQALTTEAAVKTSRHSREIMRGSVDRISRTVTSDNDEDEHDWDIIEDDPEAVATNGRDTLFARGVVDKYRLAVLKRRESTVRRKPSIKFKRSSPSSSTILGRVNDEVPPLPTTPRPSGLKHRLRNRMRTSRSLTQSPAQTFVPPKGDDQTILSAPRQLAVRNDSLQSVNSTGWSTENGSDGANSLDNRLTARALDIQEERRRGSAGV